MSKRSGMLGGPLVLASMSLTALARYELRDLHILQVTGKKEEPPTHLLEQVAPLFVNRSIQVFDSPSLSTGNVGFNAKTALGREACFCLLATLMRSWRRVPPEIQRIPSLPTAIQTHAERNEHLVMSHYCQAFYHTYGRPPIVPRKL